MSCDSQIIGEFDAKQKLIANELTKIETLSKGNYSIQYSKKEFGDPNGLETNIPENRLKPEIHKLEVEYPHITIQRQTKMNNQNTFYTFVAKLNFDFGLN